MEPIIVSIPGPKSPQEQKQEALLASCKYYKGEDQNPYEDTSSAPATFWDIERIAVREAMKEASTMLADAKADLVRVELPEAILSTVPPPILQAAFVLFGNHCSAPYWSPEFAAEFETFLRGGYGSNFV